MDAENSEEEQQYILSLREALQEEETRVDRLVEALPELDPSARIRAIRSLSGRLPPDGHPFSDLLCSDNPTYRYYLLEGLDQPLSETTFRDLRGLVNHSTSSVAGAAMQAVVRSYHLDESAVVDSLRSENRTAVIIKGLRTLYDCDPGGLDDLMDYLCELIVESSSLQVVFYASVVVKSSDPERYRSIAPGNEYLEAIDRRVSVEGTVHEGDSR